MAIQNIGSGPFFLEVHGYIGIDRMRANDREQIINDTISLVVVLCHAPFELVFIG